MFRDIAKKFVSGLGVTGRKIELRHKAKITFSHPGWQEAKGRATWKKYEEQDTRLKIGVLNIPVEHKHQVLSVHINAEEVAELWIDDVYAKYDTKKISDAVVPMCQVGDEIAIYCDNEQIGSGQFE